jgi:hypothetical protein
MKISVNLISPGQRDTVGQLTIGALYPVVARALCAAVKMYHLMAGVHCSVGAPGTAENQWLTSHIAQGPLEFRLNRRTVLLFLEATKSTAVVFNDGSIAFNSCRQAVPFGNPAIWGIDPIRHG